MTTAERHQVLDLIKTANELTMLINLYRDVRPSALIHLFDSITYMIRALDSTLVIDEHVVIHDW